MLEYADNIVIIGKTQKVKKCMIEIMKAGENIGLRVNKGKTKYVIIIRKIGILRGIYTYWLQWNGTDRSLISRGDIYTSKITCIAR